MDRELPKANGAVGQDDGELRGLFSLGLCYDCVAEGFEMTSRLYGLSDSIDFELSSVVIIVTFSLSNTPPQ